MDKSVAVSGQQDQDQAQPRDYPPRLYPEGFSNLENKEINHNFHLGDFPWIKEKLGNDVWADLKSFPVGIIAKLVDSKAVWCGKIVHYLLCRQMRVEKKEIWCIVGGEPIRFSLHEFGQITGLSIDPLPTDPNYESENFNTFWTEMNWSPSLGPKLDQLVPLLEVCQTWSFEKRKRLGLLILLVKGIYAVNSNSRIPVTSAKRVFDDEALRSYPWGRIAFEHLVVSVRLLNPQGKSYTLSGMKDVLMFWAYESVICFGERFGRAITSNEDPFLRWAGNRTRSTIESAVSKELVEHGEVRVRKMMVMKETLAEQFVQWPDEADDPQLVNLITDIYEDRYVRGSWEVQRNENENEKKKKKKNKNKFQAAALIDNEQPAKKRKKGAAVDNAEAKGTGDEGSEDFVGNDAATSTMLKLLGDIVAKLPYSETNIIEGVAQALAGMEKTIGDRVKANVVEGFVPKMDRVEHRAATHDDVIEQLRERVTALEKASGIVGSGEHKFEQPPKDNIEPSVNSPAAPNFVNLDETQSKGRSPDKGNIQVEEESVMKNSDDLEKGGTNGTSPVAEKTPSKESKESVVNKTNLEDEFCKANEKGLVHKLKHLTDKSSSAKKDLSTAFGNPELGLADFVDVSPSKVAQDGTQKLKGKPKRLKVTFESNVKKNDSVVDPINVRPKMEQAPPTSQPQVKNETAAPAPEKSFAQMKKEIAKQNRQAKAANLQKKVGHTAMNLRKRLAPPVIKEKTNVEEDSSYVEDMTEAYHASTYIQLPESEEDEDEKIRIDRIIAYRSKIVIRADGTAAKSHHPPRPPFPYIGDNGLTCMRKGCEPSKAIYDPIAPADPDQVKKLNAYLDNYWGTKLGKGTPEVEFYRQLVTPRREWVSSTVENYGWLSDDHIHAYMSLLRKRWSQDPCPFYSKRICFLDSRFVNHWKRDYGKLFKCDPSLFKILGTPYEKIVLGQYPGDQKTNLKWIEDVDHVFGIQQTGGCHWVAFHVDLQQEKIDCYDSILGLPNKESDDKMVDEFRPFTEMIPVMLNEALPNTTRKPSKKRFSFRRRTGRNIPQNLSPGDCGVYSLKYVECLALGLTFHGLCDANMQGLRVKMAAEIMAEDLGLHSDLQ